MIYRFFASKKTRMVGVKEFRLCLWKQDYRSYIRCCNEESFDWVVNFFAVVCTKKNADLAR
ncbi:hypothetical protein BZZ01_32260 [Nostocales cyanobacterium HT-58-2]|nr:hypothetical protein BZZ01_32260 [Nostocales cyanobacterium HT-58-2]